MATRRFWSPLLICAAALVSAPTESAASYAYYVGSDLTTDGSVLVGGTGEEVSSHWLEIVERHNHADDATVTVGVTEEAAIPGRRIDIPQAETTYRYISMSYTEYSGFPPPLTNGGVNEHRVAVRDVWAPSRKELVERTPTPQRGVNYSDLARLVLERATSAREGVELIGRLIEQHGYATYGGNTHLIADPDEGWVVWEFAGGEGLWAAERLDSDTVRVLYPGYIDEIPLDYRDDPDFAGSKNLVSFAEKQGWYDPKEKKTFDVFSVYGTQSEHPRTGDFKYLGPADIETSLRREAPISERDMMRYVRDFRISDDEAGYGQVVALDEAVPKELIRIWIAPTGSVTAPFNPWWLGVQRVPPEYRQHRYRTKDAGSTFLDPDYQLQEGTEFAGRLFKRLMYLTCKQPQTFREPVQEKLRAFEEESMERVQWVESAAETLLDEGKTEEAHNLLTMVANDRAAEALELGHTLVDWLDTHYKLEDAIDSPTGSINHESGPTVNCFPNGNPDRADSAGD